MQHFSKSQNDKKQVGDSPMVKKDGMQAAQQPLPAATST
jgi:hypothetical protein